MCCTGRCRDAIDPHRPNDVLHWLLSKIFEIQNKFVLNLIKSCPRDTNASSICETLDSCRDADAIPVNPISFFDHITEVDSYAQPHPSVLWQLRIPRLEFLLRSNTALDSIHHA